MIKTRNAHSQLLKEIYIKIIAKIFFMNFQDLCIIKLIILYILLSLRELIQMESSVADKFFIYISKVSNAIFSGNLF